MVYVSTEDEMTIWEVCVVRGYKLGRGRTSRNKTGTQGLLHKRIIRQAI